MQMDDFLMEVLGLEDPKLIWQVSQIAEIRRIRKGQLLFEEVKRT